MKQEKAAAATVDASPKDGEGAEDAHETNGTANGHRETDDGAERPAKKQKGPDGVVVVTPGEGVEDDDVEDEGEEVDDDEGEEADEEDEGDDRADETMEDVEDDEEEEVEDEERSGLRDEALDDGEESD